MREEQFYFHYRHLLLQQRFGRVKFAGLLITKEKVDNQHILKPWKKNTCDDITINKEFRNNTTTQLKWIIFISILISKANVDEAINGNFTGCFLAISSIYVTTSRHEQNWNSTKMLWSEFFSGTLFKLKTRITSTFKALKYFYSAQRIF